MTRPRAETVSMGFAPLPAPRLRRREPTFKAAARVVRQGARRPPARIVQAVPVGIRHGIGDVRVRPEFLFPKVREAVAIPVRGPTALRSIGAEKIHPTVEKYEKPSTPQRCREETGVGSGGGSPNEPENVMDGSDW